MFEYEELKIADVLLLKPKLYQDERGLFYEFYKESQFPVTEPNLFIQDNISISKKGVVRGLHFQKEPRQQGKLITVLKGEIFDVAVDLRPNSKSFGKYVSHVLNSESRYSIYIPKGFAHGFCSLTDETIIIYKNTSEYYPENEGGIIWNDPTVNIKWPLDNPLVSEKDMMLPTLETYISNLDSGEK